MPLYGSVMDAMAGVITRLEPPHLLELTWRENDGPESILLWTLAADGAGCRLNLVHTFPTDVRDVPGFVSGWHQHLDAVTQDRSGPMVIAWISDGHVIEHGVGGSGMRSCKHR